MTLLRSLARIPADRRRPSFGPRTRRAIASARIVAVAVGLAALCQTPFARAEELRLGVASEYVYNSNFFSSSNGEEDAHSFQIGPVLALSDPDGRLRYDLAYEGAYQAYVDQDGVDAWESRLNARITYDLSRRTSVRITERFRDISNLRFSRQDIALADTALDPNQNRYFRNDLEIELIHDLTRLLEWRLRGEHHWIDFEQNRDRNDSQAFDIGSELRMQVATRHRVGAGISYTNQDFEEALSRLGSRGEYVTGFATWIWDVTDQIVFTANGGPSWIRSREDGTGSIRQTQFVGGRQNGQLRRANIGSCNAGLASNCDFATPGAPPIQAADLGPTQSFTLAGDRVGTDSALTFFGGASVFAELAEWNLQATYSRRQSTTSGDGLASSLDRVFVEFEYAPRRLRWSAFLAGSWDRRETLTDATVIDFNVVPGIDDAAERSVAFTEVETRQTRRDNFTAIAGVRSRYSENLSGTLEFRYRRTERDDARTNSPSSDTFFVVFSVDYDLDPIEF